MAERKVALIVFYDRENKILLQDRRKISKIGEEWGFFGGGINEGETAEQAVIRETEEELGYKLTDFKYLGNCKNTFDGFVVDRAVFVSPLEDKLMGFTLGEGDGMRLFEFSGAKKLRMVPGDKAVLDLVRDYLNNLG